MVNDPVFMMLVMSGALVSIVYTGLWLHVRSIDRKLGTKRD